LNNKAPDSWMICTARQAMKKHWLKVVQWIIREKFLLFIQNNRCKRNHSEKQIGYFLNENSSNK